MIKYLILKGLNHFFLFTDYSTVYKVSFSSSFGTTTNKNAVEFCLVDKLKTFGKLSFRENPYYLGFNNLIDYNCHLDPTFLLTKEQWLNKLNCYRKRKKKYVLLFGVSEERITLSFAKRLAKERGLQLILTNYWGSNPLFGTKIVNKTDPFELLALVRDAEYVVTHSYHGYIMSIQFNVNVFYYLASYWNNSNYRFTQVIEVLNLPKWDCIHYESMDKLEPYNWEEINSKIEFERNRSIKYLQDIIYGK